MIGQMKLLTKLQICNIFGINEVRFTKDKKKKVRFWGLGALWAVVICFLLCYVAGMCFMLAKLNMAQLIPAALTALTSVFIFVFTFLKTGSAIFDQKAFELQISLPVSKAAIVVSRFANMYFTNLLFTFLIMTTGITVYGCLMHPGFSFYLYGFLGILFLPMLPITVAAMLGAVITAITAKIKYKSLAASVLTLILVAIIFCGSIALSGSDQPEIEKMIQNLAEIMEQQIGTMYPPAVWVRNAMIYGRFGEFLLFAGVSLGIFAALILVLEKCFLSICTALKTSSASKSFHLSELTTGSLRKALWKKEIKRYFASTVYVTNTMTGYLLMVIAAVALFVAGEGYVDQIIGIEGIVRKGFPFLLGIMPAMMPMTANAISMEGKHWWIVKTLPVSKKDIISGKILAYIAVAAPFYVISEVFAFLALDPGFLDGIWLLLVPGSYILFSAVAGITINLHFPVFDWVNEITVIKQSVATLLAMLTGIISSMIPLGLVFVVPDGILSLFMAVVVLVLLIITGSLCHIQCRQETIYF